MHTILVSACLLGKPCRYDGGSKPNEAVTALCKSFRCISVCPESMGGLPIPREPSENCGNRVISRDGRDVTAAYRAGAEAVLALAQKHRCRFAVLKERSPSCGRDFVYDGTFTKTLIPGNGITTELLQQNGIHVFGESEIAALLEAIKNEGTC